MVSDLSDGVMGGSMWVILMKEKVMEKGIG
jgi:hypothetical protein